MDKNKSPLSSILVIIAMILVTISRLNNGSIDWLVYAAIAVLIANVVKLFLMYRQSK